MTSSTDTVCVDPFPALTELLSPGTGGRRSALDEARARAEAEGRDAGFRVGHAEGFDAGLAAGVDAVANRVEGLVELLAGRLDEAVAQQAAVADGLAATVVDVALQLAEAVLARELEVAQSPGRDALVRALREAPATGRLVARLHPADAELLAAGDVASSDDRPIEIVADPTVESGGCVLETPTGRVDALLSTAVARAADVLRSSGDEVDS